jgi:hypothetical protein
LQSRRMPRSSSPSSPATSASTRRSTGAARRGSGTS